MLNCDLFCLWYIDNMVRSPVPFDLFLVTLLRCLNMTLEAVADELAGLSMRLSGISDSPGFSLMAFELPGML